MEEFVFGDARIREELMGYTVSVACSGNTNCNWDNTNNNNHPVAVGRSVRVCVKETPGTRRGSIEARLWHEQST